MLVKLSNVLELVGAVLLLVAAFALDWRAGVALLGVSLAVVGYFLDPGEAS